MLNDRSEPEPDIVVAVGDWQDYVERHPRVNQIRLVVEVSDTTPAFDRTEKAGVYARAQIAEYWILNVNARTLLVHTNPHVTNERNGRWAYHVVTLTSDDAVSPLGIEGVEVRVGDLFPPVVT